MQRFMISAERDISVHSGIHEVCQGAEGNSMFILSVGSAEACPGAGASIHVTDYVTLSVQVPNNHRVSECQ